MGRYQRALVTGGAGFIGAALVQALLTQGLEVVVFDNLSQGRPERVPAQARLIAGDLLDLSALRSAIAGVDIVFHQAARVSVRSSVEEFAEDARINVMGTINLLQACLGSAVRRLIYASSMAVYADSPTATPIDERHPTEPLSPYGISKLAGEKYCLAITRQAGIDSVVLRYFNVYGPGQAFTPYVGVMTIFMQRLLHGQPPVIFGDGTQCRDFVHVNDVVGANLLAMEKEAAGEILNIGSGRGVTVNEIAALIAAKLGSPLQPLWGTAQPGEVTHSIANIAKAQGLLGYQPRGRLQEDLDEIIAWQKRHPAFSVG